jgi:hypothetical protein
MKIIIIIIIIIINIIFFWRQTCVFKRIKNRSKLHMLIELSKRIETIKNNSEKIKYFLHFKYEHDQCLTSSKIKVLEITNTSNDWWRWFVRILKIPSLHYIQHFAFHCERFISIMWQCILDVYDSFKNHHGLVDRPATLLTLKT